MCENAISSGFAPTSKTPEELSKAMENYTTQAGSISYGWRYENSLKENHNMSMQMVGRPLMTPDEIKRIPKGEFVILKTGANPMKINIPFYSDWGIELNDDFVPETRKIVVPKYISVRELKDKIVQEAIKESEEKEVEKKSLYDKLKRG